MALTRLQCKRDIIGAVYGIVPVKGIIIMRMPIHTVTVAFVLITIVFLPAVHAATLDETKNLIAEAKQLRATEFAPEHFADAREALADAEDMLNRRKSAESIRRLLDEAQINASEASSISQSFSQKFRHLVESRDRMQLSDSKKFRADLAKRAEDDFARVVEAFEDGHERKARSIAKMARNTVHAAEVVAAREQISKPLSRAIAGARRVKARKYAPKALAAAAKAHSAVERTIKENPKHRHAPTPLPSVARCRPDVRYELRNWASSLIRNPQQLSIG